MIVVSEGPTSRRARSRGPRTAGRSWPGSTARPARKPAAGWPAPASRWSLAEDDAGALELFGRRPPGRRARGHGSRRRGRAQPLPRPCGTAEGQRARGRALLDAARSVGGPGGRGHRAPGAPLRLAGGVPARRAARPARRGRGRAGRARRRRRRGCARRLDDERRERTWRDQCDALTGLPERRAPREGAGERSRRPLPRPARWRWRCSRSSTSSSSTAAWAARARTPSSSRSPSA